MMIPSDNSRNNAIEDFRLPIEKGFKALLKEYMKRLRVLFQISIIGLALLGFIWFMFAESEILLLLMIVITIIGGIALTINSVTRKGRKSKPISYAMPFHDENVMLFSIFMDILAALVAPIYLINLDLELNILNLNTPIFITLVLFTRIITFYMSKTYVPQHQASLIFEVMSTSFKMLISIFVVLIVLFLMQIQPIIIFAIISVLTGISLFTHLIWRIIFYFLSYYSTVRNFRKPQQILIIGATESGRNMADLISRFPFRTAQVVGFLDNEVDGLIRDVPVIGTLNENLFAVIHEHRIDKIILTTPTNESDNGNNSVFNSVQHVPIPVLVIPDNLDLTSDTIQLSSLDELPLLNLWQPVLDGPTRLAKRLFDIIVASIGLIGVSVAFVTIGLLIWIYDRGPVFYSLDRYGENGKIFKMLKFRSMIINAEEMDIIHDDGKSVTMRRNDPRVTPIGKLIRKTSLDELPQLLNIIRGDMSIVGPRPEVRSIVESKYEPWQYVRMRVPQGLTGWWQVNSRGEKEAYMSVEEDIYYLENHSFWLDIKIILMTYPAVLRGNWNF